MHRWIFCTLILTVVGADGVAHAQQPQPGRSNVVLNPTIMGRLRWVQFDVQDGRLVVNPLHVGTQFNTSHSGLDGRRENFKIDLTGATPNIRYELSTKTAEILLEVINGEQFVIRHVKKGESDAANGVEFRQVPSEELSLTVTSGENKRTLTATTIWHLLLEEPAACKEYLSPVLETLRPGWQPMQTATAIEQSLMHHAKLRPTTDRERWQDWIAALASEKFSARESAQRQLVESGREILPFLHSLDRERLDAEQWRRVRDVIELLDGQQSDSVEQVVAFMAGDARTWVALLGREDESVRRLAVEQLTSLTGEKIDFDPSAAADVRSKQLETLREKFTPKPAAKE